MTADPSTLRGIYVGWERYNGLLIDMLRPLSEVQLAVRAAPHLWSVGQLAAHVVSARAYWFHEVLREGPATLAPLIDLDEAVPAPDAADIVAGLEASWALIAGCLDRWHPADLAAVFVTRRQEERSRGWVVWHVAEHDLHHGGEISLSLGMAGLPTSDL